MSAPECRNCYRPIRRVNWARGPGWVHENGLPSCQHLHAAPCHNHVGTSRPLGPCPACNEDASPPAADEHTTPIEHDERTQR